MSWEIDLREKYSIMNLEELGEERKVMLANAAVLASGYLERYSVLGEIIKERTSAGDI